MDRLKDKIAVVTGATSGIGEAVARMYVKEGAKVVCIGRNKEKGAALVQELEAAGGEAIFVPADLHGRGLRPEHRDELPRVHLDDAGVHSRDARAG